MSLQARSSSVSDDFPTLINNREEDDPRLDSERDNHVVSSKRVELKPLSLSDKSAPLQDDILV